MFKVWWVEGVMPKEGRERKTRVCCFYVLAETAEEAISLARGHGYSQRGEWTATEKNVKVISLGTRIR